MQVAKIKDYKWTMVKVPLLLLYLVVLAKSGEITVMCRSVAHELTEYESSISVFVFFEIEVFAFFGIILGLWIWLTLKFILNCIFQDGPRHAFKTEGVKHAKDLLMRNNEDAFITTGILWTFAINMFLNSELNEAKDLMADYQKDLITYLIAIEISQVAFLMLLKVLR